MTRQYTIKRRYGSELVVNRVEDSDKFVVNPKVKPWGVIGGAVLGVAAILSLMGGVYIAAIMTGAFLAVAFATWTFQSIEDDDFYFITRSWKVPRKTDETFYTVNDYYGYPDRSKRNKIHNCLRAALNNESTAAQAEAIIDAGIEAHKYVDSKKSRIELSEKLEPKILELAVQIEEERLAKTKAAADHVDLLLLLGKDRT